MQDQSVPGFRNRRIWLRPNSVRSTKKNLPPIRKIKRDRRTNERRSKRREQKGWKATETENQRWLHAMTSLVRAPLADWWRRRGRGGWRDRKFRERGWWPGVEHAAGYPQKRSLAGSGSTTVLYTALQKEMFLHHLYMSTHLALLQLHRHERQVNLSWDWLWESEGPIALSQMPLCRPCLPILVQRTDGSKRDLPILPKNL